MYLSSSVCQRRTIAIVALLGIAMGNVHAQAPNVGGGAFPAKPVRIVVPFPPGGPADLLGRMFAEKLSPTWGQPVMIDNRAGAGGNLGSELVAKTAADGYTILLAASSHVTNGALYPKLPYDPIKDFSPISQIAYYSLVLVAHPSVPATSLQELVAFGKANPGKLTFASAGTGTPTHLTAELFRGIAGFDFLHVPYKGAAPATNDLLGGQVQLMFNNPVSALPHVKSAQLRALATTGLRRSLIAPGIPTVAELGYPGFEAGTWFAFIGPAGIAPDVLAKLAYDINAVATQNEVRSRLAAQGVEAVGTSPAQLGEIMRSDLEKWTKVIRAANIKPD